MTEELYLEDPYRRECLATVTGIDPSGLLFDRTVFYPGGGGQPADRGVLVWGEARIEVPEAGRNRDGDIWHQCAPAGHPEPGEQVVARIDWRRRHALMRHHALMHVVNTVAWRDHGGLITGVQLGADRSRVDFRIAEFDPTRLAAFEERVNGILDSGAAISSSYVTEAEFLERPELIRTLNVVPPIIAGRVRVVEIEGFDAQACGGTHVHSLAEVGIARIVGYDNKGRHNKRLYWTLEESDDVVA